MTSKKDRRRPLALSLSLIPESFMILSQEEQGRVHASTHLFSNLTIIYPLGGASSAHSPELRPTTVHLPERLTVMPGA
ncbi:hypothetical protein J2T16_003847 [Paenibacillus intestini]|nr:hypothetical protein [Paenibacillus intestini]